jgi:3',5'-cyclic-AMP phosphodiesterase
MNRADGFVFAPWLVLLAVGCARPGQGRAERDRTVGQAANATIDVRVSGGLAAVRKLSSDRLLLWASAPGFELQLILREPTTLRLEIENAMPNAALTELQASTPLPPEPGENPTKKSWQLTLPAGPSRFRLATPEAATEGPFRFALMSDVQEAIDRVSDIYRLVNAEPDLSFLLGAGDLTQQGSVEQLARYDRELAALGVPYYTTLGNHELGNSPPPFQESHGRANFQFAYRGVYFTLLDSASGTLDPIVYGWLDDWLARARARVHIVAMHIPPLDPIGVRNGSFASRAEAAALLGDLAEGGVDLTLYGHIHSYYSFDNAGIPAFISGGGGAIPERFDDIGRHFMVFDVDPKLGVTEASVVRVD